MLVTTIKMSEVKDKRNPLNDSTWREATEEEKQRVNNTLSKIRNK